MTENLETGCEIQRVGPLEQAIRFHACGDEIHFQVEAESLKVIVPSTEWWSAFEHLKTGRQESFHYIDHANGCTLTVTAGVNDRDEFDVVPRLSKIVEKRK